MEVQVENRDGQGCRQDLASSIEVSLCCGGARISKGWYRVTIERIDGPAPKEEKTDADT